MDKNSYLDINTLAYSGIKEPEKKESANEADAASLHAIIESAYVQGLSSSEVSRHVSEFYEQQGISQDVFLGYSVCLEHEQNFDYFMFDT